MKKLALFAICLALTFSELNAKTIYLNPGGSSYWDQSGAVFFAHAWGDGSDQDVMMSSANDDLYSAEIGDAKTSIIFVRMPNGSTSLDWESKWNQTADLTIGSNNCYTITGWETTDGAWSTIDTPTPETTKHYLVGNGQEGGDWCCGKNWDAAGCEMVNDTVEYTNLPAGSYSFKITNGTWDKNWGSANIDASCSTSGYGSDSDGNITFKLGSESNVTISFVASKICLHIDGEVLQPYTGSVPSQCGDVLLQGFFYDSFEVDSTHKGTLEYGDTKWKTLLAQSSEIGAYFDLIWLPPSAYASGTGYHPRQYSNQSSDWGSRTDLEKLIAAFHNSGTKVVADMVVNHLEAMSGWCEFATMNFGEYGTYTPDASWICNTDELNDAANKEEAGDCYGQATGAADDGPWYDGNNESNYAAARDMAHNQENVREMYRAYAKWLTNVMHYDGFRYDYCKGFHASHINEYNTAAEAYISFMELWASESAMEQAIGDANNNTMSLDFQTKYAAFNNGIVAGNYMGCKGSGLLGAGKSKYAVTFIDNHDTFLRDNNEAGGYGNSMKESLKDKMLQSNAFLLAMPGVPCVFYPHWVKYKAEIKQMINARHAAGVHSESEVKDEYAEADGYQATIVGKNGYLILCIGNKAGQSFSGYTKMATGNGYDMWVQANNAVAPGLVVTPSASFEDMEKGINVTIKAEGGTCDSPAIYYTTDESEPTTSSAVYSDTLNFKTTTTLKVMAVCGESKSRVQTYTYTYREPLERGIRIRFDKPEEWEKVYIYAWQPGVDEKGNATSENIMGAYPGQQIYQAIDGWYTYEFDTSLDSVHFCINSGNDCGSLNVRSNDLVADYDACYGWLEGSADVEKSEIVLDCDAELDPEFSLAISPETSYFRDLENGIDITITAIGQENAMIYYTIDGTEPTTASNSAQGTVTFNIKQTTTVKAYAVKDKDTHTDVITNIYTYKAPQTGAITVKFLAPQDSIWEQVYLYAFTRVKVGGKYKDTPYAINGVSANAKWPGMKWTTIDENGWHSFTFPEELKDFFVIFNIGSNKTQTQDINITEDACYIWNPDCWRAVLSPNCDGETPVKEIYSNDIPMLDLDAPMYNVLGIQVDKTYKGIVIQNGNKYILNIK